MFLYIFLLLFLVLLYSSSWFRISKLRSYTIVPCIQSIFAHGFTRIPCWSVSTHSWIRWFWPKVTHPKFILNLMYSIFIFLILFEFLILFWSTISPISAFWTHSFLIRIYFISLDLFLIIYLNEPIKYNFELSYNWLKN